MLKKNYRTALINKKKKTCKMNSTYVTIFRLPYSKFNDIDILSTPILRSVQLFEL